MNVARDYLSKAEKDNKNNIKRKRDEKRGVKK